MQFRCVQFVLCHNDNWEFGVSQVEFHRSIMNKQVEVLCQCLEFVFIYCLPRS